jgi:carboxymethylenebutenolidase
VAGQAGPSTTPAEAVTFPGPEGVQLLGAFAPAQGTAKGNALIIHENKGLTDHFKALPLRLAADGYHALAVDLLSREGGTGTFTDPAAATAALTAAPRERLVADALAGVTELLRRAPEEKVGAMGFCFGGGMSWSLVASGDPRLAAVVPFYGTIPEGASFAASKAAVLGIYAELDARVNATRDAAAAALAAAGLTYEIKTYPGVDHAFFNDTGPRYSAAAAATAYTDLLAWFGKHLAASLPVTS